MRRKNLAIELTGTPAAWTATTDQHEVLNTVLHPNDSELRYNSVMHPSPDIQSVKHSFSDRDLAEFAKHMAPVIVHHGASVSVDGYSSRFVHTEVLPIFVTRDVAIDNLSLNQLKQIVEGRMASWSQIDGRDRAISIVRHSDNLKAKALDFQLATQHISVGSGTTFSNSYENLAKTAIDKGGALLLGLRGAPARRYRPYVKAIAIDGHTPMSGPQYPFRVPIQMLVCNDRPMATEMADSLLKVAERRSIQDGMNAQVMRDWYTTRLD